MRGSIAVVTMVGAVTIGGLHVAAQQRRATSAPDGGAMLLTNAWLIDGTGAPALERAWVRIDGETITAAGQGTPPPTRGAQPFSVETAASKTKLKKYDFFIKKPYYSTDYNPDTNFMGSTSRLSRIPSGKIKIALKV